MSQGMDPTFGVVMLTMGRRPELLARAVNSVLMQENVKLDIVVVGNGWDPVGLPPQIRTRHLPENLGIPAGRNAGVGDVTGEFIFFLDDDCALLDAGHLAECARRFRADSHLGMIQPRMVDPDRPGEEPGRWIPRLRKNDPRTITPVFSVMEAAVVLRRSTFDAAGGWPGSFFYAHEGIELAWRVWDQGMKTEHHADLRAAHPVVHPTRHDEYYFMNARNRVWLARRCLHWPFSWIYVLSWTLVQLARERNPHALRTWFTGWLAGWRTDPWGHGPHLRKLRWSTIIAMGRAGRLPVI